MKKLLITIALALPILGIGQTQTENYVKTTAYQVAVTAGQENNLADTQKIENIAYVDGLGRPKQSIAVKAGGASQNIMSYVEYDDLGRTPIQYLPYATPGEVSNPLEFVDQETLKGNIGTFYNTPKYEDTQNPFSEMVYEPSPLNRVLEQAAPGNSWAMANSHTIKLDYQSNAQDEVRYFDVDFTGGDTQTPTLTLSGYYTVNELYKSVTKDENWTSTSGNNHTTESFTNKQGQVILKRTYTDNQAHDTYYVYDDFGNLTFVLSPEGSEKIVIGDILRNNAGEILNDLCYQYVYDYRNRLIKKKIPAKGWEHIFYDLLDRPTLTQDARLRENNQYLFTKYDALNRVLYTGIYQAAGGTTTAEAMQATISAQSSYNETRIPDAIPIGDANAYYSNGVFPTTGVTVHTVNYYDTYIDHAGITLPASVYGKAITTQTQGLPTVSKIRVLNDQSDWITSVTGYDYKARPIYGVSLNTYLETDDTSETLLDFTGKVVESKTTHQKAAHQEMVITDYFTYDHQNRLITQMQQIDQEPLQLIASNTYDELGQLASKHVGGQLFESGYTDPVGVSVSGDGKVITKTDPTDGYNAGLATVGKLEGDGGISFNGLTPGSEIHIGLNDISTNAGGYDMNYYFRLENSTSGPKFRAFRRALAGGGSTLLYTGLYDINNNSFAIEREGNNLHFIHNGTVVVTTALEDPSIALLGDLSIKTPNAQIGNLTFYTTTIDKSLQKVDYNYNVRGWLTDINDVDTQARDVNLFNFHINYDTTVEGDAGISGQAVPLYNGNISQTTWKSANADSQKRTYGYKYDALNRIKTAYSRKGTDLTDYDHFNVSGIDYDKNGNIETLTRQGDYNGNALVMDDLIYTYNGNQLLAVSDSGHVNLKNKGFYDGNTSGNDYIYDVNGNLTADKNKGITIIEYNHLNLPTEVKINTTDAEGDAQEGLITYIYDATGIKLAKVLKDNIQQRIITTSYASGYIYEDTNGTEVLQLLPHPEGYVAPITIKGVASYQYAFNYTDHLGNVRLTYSDSNNDGAIDPTTEIISEKHYYPFGLQQQGYNDVVTSNSNSMADKFKYNGVEQEQALGLNLYEMPLRQYDPAIARWTSLDPIVHYDYSTYSAFDNNPVFWADASGANSTAQWMEENGITNDDLINIYQADGSNSNSSNNEDGPGDPPKRGKGKNAPYIYELIITYQPEDADEPIETPYHLNPDKGYSHFNSLFYHESRIPNRFIAHYLHGNGAQYDLTMEEFKEIAVTRPNILNSRQFLEAPFGTSEGEFIVTGVFSHQDGTVGEASFLYKGTLEKSFNGYSFKGTMELRDRYDFNWQDKERTFDNKMLTLWGAVSMWRGTSFRIVGPKINITENPQGHSYFGPSGSGRSEINKGKE